MNEKTEKPMMNNAQIKQIMHANDLAIAEVKRLREKLEHMTTLCKWWIDEAERLEEQMEAIV
jgi:malonyl CoA-acyl carrier protein transacylase